MTCLFHIWTEMLNRAWTRNTIRAYSVQILPHDMPVLVSICAYPTSLVLLESLFDEVPALFIFFFLRPCPIFLLCSNSIFNFYFLMLFSFYPITSLYGITTHPFVLLCIVLLMQNCYSRFFKIFSFLAWSTIILFFNSCILLYYQIIICENTLMPQLGILC